MNMALLTAVKKMMEKQISAALLGLVWLKVLA